MQERTLTFPRIVRVQPCIWLSFGLGKELHGCVLCLEPSPPTWWPALRGIGQIVKAHLRPQQDLSRLRCRVAAISDHCLTEHHLEFERQTLAFWVLRKPFQHSERTGLHWPPH